MTNHKIKDKGEGEGLVGLSVLTKEQQKRNSAIADCRARVESPFGWMQQKFKCFEKPFQENIHQFEHVVKFAICIHNNMC